MNFFEIINKCLVELNYKEVESWSRLISNDHKRLREVVRRMNQQICCSADWSFMERESGTRLLAGQKFFHNPTTGKIKSLFIDDNEYFYTPDYRSFFLDNPPAMRYTAFGEHIYFPPFDKNVECKLLYVSEFSAKDEDGEEKRLLENETDVSLLPESFREPLLVYGSCLRFKANPEHVKFKYWYSMFNDILSTMRSRCNPSRSHHARINLLRE